jgi:cytochrome c-type biogenesis protein CcmH/NrfF
VKLGLGRRIGWLVVVAAIAVSIAVVVAAEDPPATLDERAYRLKETTLCPECDGQNVLESNAPVSAAIRSQIDELVDEGRSDQEIRQFLTGQYGRGVDASPPSTGFASLVWVLPVVVVAVGLVWLAWSFSRWRAGRRVGTTDEDRDLVARLRHGS